MDYINYLLTPPFFIGILITTIIFFYIKSWSNNKRASIVLEEIKITEVLLEANRNGGEASVYNSLKDFGTKYINSGFIVWRSLALWVAHTCAMYNYSSELHEEIMNLAKICFGEDSFDYNRFVAIEKLIDTGTVYYLDEEGRTKDSSSSRNPSKNINNKNSYGDYADEKLYDIVFNVANSRFIYRYNLSSKVLSK